MVRCRCLAILYLSITLPIFRPILSAPASRPAATAASDRGQELFGGGEQFAAFAGAFGRQ